MSLPEDPDWDGYIELPGAEVPSTFGGEYRDSEGSVWDSYGIDFGVVKVSGISHKQMAHLAAEIVNHLRLNGHEFEFRETRTSQDQPVTFNFIR